LSVTLATKNPSSRDKRWTAATYAIWMTCCALHNHLLEVDGLDKKWTRGVSSDYEKEAYRLSMDEFRQAYGASVGTNTTTDFDNAGMGHDGDVDSPLPSTIDSSILSDDGDNMVPSRSTTTAAPIVRKQSETLLLELFCILLPRKVIRWPSRIGLPLSDNVRVVLRGAPYVEQSIIKYSNETISTPMKLLMIQANNQLSNNQL
jgi:hypothetical protein